MEFDKNARVILREIPFTAILGRLCGEVERQVCNDRTLRQRKRMSKLLSSKNFQSKAKKCGASSDVHASSRNILVANSTLVIKAYVACATHNYTWAYLRMRTSD